jgi:DNA-binding MarR family transcriptional regulator
MIAQWPPEDPEALVWSRLVKTYIRIHAELQAAFKAAELPPAEWFDVLNELKKVASGALRPVELQERLLVSQPNMSRLLDRLQAEKLVERLAVQGDGRAQQVQLTSQGRALHKRMLLIHKQVLGANVSAHFSEEQLGQLGRWLQRLL